MSRLCWFFVLVAVVVVAVVPSCDARPHKCEQRERSLADLDLAEDALNRARDLFPNCEEENESSNSTECSKKDKSLGFLDVALDLVSNAKKNIPICPHIPTEEPLTTSVVPLTNATSVEPLTNATSVEPLTNATSVEPTPEVTTERVRPIDCQELRAVGVFLSGVYRVWPQVGKAEVWVRCDMDTDGGGWTVIQRRGNFSRQENFDRDWKDYKNGFGNLERDFWFGNDNIFALSNQGNYSLRMDMTAADGDSAYALYREFRIEDESANYELHLRGYGGTAGAQKYNHFHNEMFTTKDRKNNRLNTVNCAEERKGGFWYWRCNDTDSNPNGLYNPGVEDQTSMYFHSFKGYSGLSSFDMKLRRM